jgi:hypothetical protein
MFITVKRRPRKSALRYIASKTGRYLVAFNGNLFNIRARIFAFRRVAKKKNGRALHR